MKQNSNSVVMAISKTGLAIALLFSITAVHAQLLNQNWKQDLTTSLQQFLECGEGNTNPNCSGFAGKSLNTVYKINDFYSQKSGRYMTVNEIAKFLQENRQWTSLGKSYDQKILETAQEYANSKKAVVAVYQNAQGMGHVVVITPGILQPSGSWGLKVPNAASFLTTDPQKSFIDKAMSFAFAKTMMKDITIYARVY